MSPHVMHDLSLLTQLADAMKSHMVHAIRRSGVKPTSEDPMGQGTKVLENAIRHLDEAVMWISTGMTKQ